MLAFVWVRLALGSAMSIRTQQGSQTESRCSGAPRRLHAGLLCMARRAAAQLGLRRDFVFMLWRVVRVSKMTGGECA